MPLLASAAAYVSIAASFDCGSRAALRERYHASLGGGGTSAWQRPVDQQGLAVRARAEVRELPIAVDQGRRSAVEAARERRRIVSEREDERHDISCALGELLPALRDDSRHGIAPTARRFDDWEVAREERPPVRVRHQPDRVFPLPERRVELRHVIEEPQMLVKGDNAALRQQPARSVVHEQRATPAVATQAACGSHHRCVEARRELVEQSGLPHEKGSARDITSCSHDPVVVDVEVLHDVALTVDHHALECTA